MKKLEKKLVAVSSGFLYNSEGKFLFLKRALKSSWGVGEWQLVEGKIEWGKHRKKQCKEKL